MMIVLGPMKNVIQLIKYVGFHAMAFSALIMKSVILSRNFVSLVKGEEILITKIKGPQMFSVSACFGRYAMCLA